MLFGMISMKIIFESVLNSDINRDTYGGEGTATLIAAKYYWE